MKYVIIERAPGHVYHIMEASKAVAFVDENNKNDELGSYSILTIPMDKKTATDEFFYLTRVARLTGQRATLRG